MDASHYPASVGGYTASGNLPDDLLSFFGADNTPLQVSYHTAADTQEIDPFSVR